MTSPSTAPTRVALLGLGRMGAAAAHRLADSGCTVTTWSRGGSTLDGIPSAPTAADAVAAADVVLLALYDAAACADVLSDCLPAIRPEAVVVNIATVAPAEAEALAAQAHEAGRDYLHSPVLGSVPAVEAGSLTLLVGQPTVAGTTAEVLTTLGMVLSCPDGATSAALKLVANSVLATCVTGLGAALARAERLGLDRDLAVDVLQRTQLGPLATAKRPWLTGADGTATFTTGALLKDLRLLEGADPTSAPLVRQVEAAGAPEHADIGAISAGLGSDGLEVDPVSRLRLAAGVPGDPDLLAPLAAYARGHATGDPAHFLEAFLPTARVEGARGGRFESWDLDAYCRLFDGSPARDEARRVRTLTELRRTDTVAAATMVLEHGTDTFTDLFLLVRDPADGSWRIANKAYHREPAPTGLQAGS